MAHKALQLCRDCEDFYMYKYHLGVKYICSISRHILEALNYKDIVKIINAPTSCFILKGYFLIIQVVHNLLVNTVGTKGNCKGARSHHNKLNNRTVLCSWYDSLKEVFFWIFGFIPGSRSSFQSVTVFELLCGKSSQVCCKSLRFHTWSWNPPASTTRNTLNIWQHDKNQNVWKNV